MSDDGSFEKFFRETYKWLLGLLLRRFGIPRESAKDTAQEAFCRVFPKWETIRDMPIGQKRAYLLRTARNVYLNSLRSQIRIEVPYDENSDPPESHRLGRPGGTMPPSIEQRLIETEEDRRRRAWLASAIDRLPPRQRDVILLRLRGLPYKEIARLLETSEDAVRGGLRDARQNLRAFLGEQQRTKQRTREPENHDDHQE